jgi:hypothetical protein
MHTGFKRFDWLKDFLRSRETRYYFYIFYFLFLSFSILVDAILLDKKNGDSRKTTDNHTSHKDGCSKKRKF